MIHRRAIAIVGACAAVMVSAYASGAAPGVKGRPSDEPAGQVSCDVDGVTTSFGTGLGTARHEVGSVSVSELAPTCVGAELSVRLALAGGGSSGGGPVAVDGPGETVPVVSAPAAREVVGVHVELVGGEVPVPPACAAMEFGRVFSGTVDADRLTGSNGGDLVFGLPADDRLTGGNGADCLDGGPGADDLRGENQADVLLGGAGADRLDGGTLDDVLLGGDGDDTLVGGPGRDRCVGGEGTDSFVGCEEQEQ